MDHMRPACHTSQYHECILTSAFCCCNPKLDFHIEGVKVSALEPFFFSAATSFRDQSIDARVRHGIATAFRAVAINHYSQSIKAMNE
jgi:hypothetical protein